MHPLMAAPADDDEVGLDAALDDDGVREEIRRLSSELCATARGLSAVVARALARLDAARDRPDSASVEA